MSNRPAYLGERTVVDTQFMILHETVNISSVPVPFEVIVDGLWSRDCKCTWHKGSLYKQKLTLKIVRK